MANELAEKIKVWFTRPDVFVREALDVTPTKQQEDALKEWGTLIRVKTKRSEGLELTNFEKPYVTKIGMSVHSGHTTGKDAFAAWLILHFLICTLYPKIICTAPTDSQLRAILWSEINKWLRKSRIKDFITAQAEKIYFTEAGGKEWFAIPGAQEEAAQSSQSTQAAETHCHRRRRRTKRRSECLTRNTPALLLKRIGSNINGFVKGTLPLVLPVPIVPTMSTP